MDETDKEFNMIACRSCRTKPCRYFLWHREANPILVLSEDIGKPDCIFVTNKLLGKFELSSIPKHTIEQSIANFRSKMRLDPFQTYSWKSPDMDPENGNGQNFLRLVEDGDIKIIRPPVSQKQFERFKEWFEESEKLKQYNWLPPASEIDFEAFVEEDLSPSPTPTVASSTAPIPYEVIVPPTVTPATKSGIAGSKDVDEFTKEFKKVKNDWVKLTENERRQRLKNSINKQLSKCGVPEVGVRSKDLSSHENGHFGFTNWEVVVNKNLVSKGSLTDDEAKSLANTLYHESRHAEQWYRMAQKQAADGKSVKEIRDELGIPGNVAKNAANTPLDKKSQEYKEGEDWYNSVYGKNRDARNKTLKELPTKIDAYNKAVENYKKVLSDSKASPRDKEEAFKKQQAAYSDMQNGYKDYRNLPEEQDAWATGDSVSKLW